MGHAHVKLAEYSLISDKGGSSIHDTLLIDPDTIPNLSKKVITNTLKEE